ncbi:MAG: FAD-binding oxidoreductase [Chitinophagaceae bacterium]|nr:FAD-binding oxidoreductase [Chitinophagaceae bacterium]
MRKDVLIIGQGICGTFLGWWLEQKGLSYIVIDEQRPHTASRAAAGLINPVTGRRIVKTWMIDDLLSFAGEAYGDLGAALQVDCLTQTRVVDFFPTAQMRLAFLQRYEEDPQYLQLPSDEQHYRELFHYDLGYGIITPCYLADLPRLLPAFRKRLLQQNTLIEAAFDHQSLIVEAQGITYKDITADRIIFCDGIQSADSPYFSRIPFAPNKGEALIIDIPDLPLSATVFKKGMTLAPWKDGLYWVGSSYEWSFTDAGPTEIFKQKTEALLKDWLKVPFRIIDHVASIRPATLERRPFVGFHPIYPAIGILNGMGTKGCSLAPYFAHQLVEHIVHGGAIRPDADVRRFTKILSR